MAFIGLICLLLAAACLVGCLALVKLDAIKRSDNAVADVILKGAIDFSNQCRNTITKLESERDAALASLPKYGRDPSTGRFVRRSQ